MSNFKLAKAEGIGEFLRSEKAYHENETRDRFIRNPQLITKVGSRRNSSQKYSEDVADLSYKGTFEARNDSSNSRSLSERRAELREQILVSIKQ